MAAPGSPAAALLARAVDTSSHPMLNVIDPDGTTVFAHLSNYQAEATVFALCYYSLWFGALGWDIVSTLPFDFVLLRDTRWSSAPSAMHSFAYLASRYTTLAWIGLSTWNITVVSNSCATRMVVGSVLFGISFCATGLIFVLRTIAIWQLNWKVVLVLAFGWLHVLGWAISIPFTVTAYNLPGSSFCEYSMGHTKFFGVWTAVVLVDLLCLGLTIAKLNKAGLRTILSGLLPQLSPSVDSEKIAVVVVQRTTAFFAVRFVILISSIAVYATTEGLNYQLAQIIACVAMSASMAGRLFRKAWRLTRARSDGHMPPVYCSGWAQALGHDPVAAAAAAARKETMGGVGDVPEATRSPKEAELFDEDYYVEGMFMSRSATSLRLRRPSVLTMRTEGRASLSERYAQAHRDLAARSEGSEIELAEGAQRRPSHRSLRAPPSRGGRSDMTATGSSPFDSVVELGTAPVEAANAAPDTIVHIGHHAINIEPTTTSLFTSAHDDEGSLQRSPTHISRSPSTKRPTTGDSLSGRDDLNPLPTFSRLWLDSSAARQRREQHGDTHTISSSAGSSSGGASLQARRKTARTTILQGMDSAEQRIIDVEQSQRTNADAQSDSRTYVASPAIVTTPTLSSRSERWTYDVDALKNAVSVTLDGSRTPGTGPSSPTMVQFPSQQPPAGPSFLHTQPSVPSLRGLALTASPGKARPRTAPGETSHSRSQAVTAQKTLANAADDEALLLNAFRRAVEDDIQEHHHVRSNSFLLGSPIDSDAIDSSRPRTARGTPTSAWDQRRGSDVTSAAAAAAAMNAASEGGRRGSASAGSRPSSSRLRMAATMTPPRSRDRPTTSNGSTVKPFGAGCPGFDASAGSVLRRKTSSRLNTATSSGEDEARAEPTIEALFHSLEDTARRDSADFGRSVDTTAEGGTVDGEAVVGMPRLERIESAGEREADGVERLQ